LKSNGTTFYLISDGTIKMDGGGVFGQVPRLKWQEMAAPDRQNRIRLGLNCLLIRNGKHCILVDTGVGNKEPRGIKDTYGLGNSRLLRELRARDISPKDITDVVLTHLHFDHSGGSTRLDRAGTPVPTFPNATYYVQEASWEEANQPGERAAYTYHPDDFLPLKRTGQLQLLQGDTEFDFGVRVKVTDAHTEGHQMVLLNHGGEKLAFMGDLIPTPHHLQLTCIAAADKTPESTLELKREFLLQAEREGLLLLFSHGFESRAGYVEYRDGRWGFRRIDF